MDFKTLRTPFILDGATGTELQKRGMPAGACGEAWILEHPEALRELQRGYADAGAQAVYAPTFGASRLALARHGLGDKVADFNRRLVALSREAVEGRALVGGDLAPTGLALGGVDEALFEKLYENFREQAAALEEAGVDFYAVETQMSLAEARATVMAVRSVSAKPVFVTFTLGADGRTLSGGDIRAALLALLELNIDAFGLNCVGDLSLLRYTLSDLGPLTRLPLIAKPNAGFPRTEDGKPVYDLPPEALAALAEPLMESGAVLLGGCCGTDARHTAALRDAAARAERRMREIHMGDCYASEYEVVDYRAERAARPEDADELDEEAIPYDWELDATVLRSLAVDADFEDAAEAAAREGVQMLKLRLNSAREVDDVLDSQLAVRTPLWVVVPDEALRRRFLRYYHGRAKVDAADTEE